MNRLLIVTTAAAALFSTHTFAADPVMPTPVIPITPVVDSSPIWDGLYAGLNAGYGWGDIYSGGAVLSDELDGFVGGVQAGYNVQMDMFVLGVEGDIQASTMSFTGGGDTAAVDYFGTVRARLGVAMDNVLPYVTGGVAFGQGRADDGVDVDRQFHVGWAAGAGVEVAMDNDVSFKLEYLYTDLGEKLYGPPAGIDLGYRFHSVRAGVNFHF